MIKKYFKFIIFIFALFILITTPKVFAKEDDNLREINIYVFTQEGCKNCANMKKYLNNLNLDNVIVSYYDINDDSNRDLYIKMKEVFIEEDAIFGIPFTIIGGKYFIGYNSSIEKSINNYITYFSNNEYSDKVPYYDIVKLYENNEEIKKDYLIEDSYYIPIIGRVTSKNANLFIVSVILGFLDGINPCGMWILLFILSLLIPTNNKKKILILGGTFILVSGIFYFIIMMAWINIMGLFNSSKLLLLITGIFALGFGIYNIYKYIKAKIKKNEGCDVQSAEQKRKLSKKVKKIVTNEKLLIAVFGIALVTITVNLVEVACSAGWPAIFTNLLVASNISKAARFKYTLIYILFFLIDDILVFVIALSTLKIKAVSNVLTKYTHLIGGILMIIFGLLMVFFPEFVTLYL